MTNVADDAASSFRSKWQMNTVLGSEAS